MNREMTLQIKYSSEMDAYYILTNFGVLGWLYPEMFAAFVLGATEILEANHPELMPLTGAEAIEQANRILKGNGHE